MLFHSCFLYLIAFIGGTTIMMLEMVGFRMLAPYFGYSIYVSGSLLGIIMLALSVGYFFGGVLADRYKTLMPVYLVMLAAAGYTLLIILFYRPLLFNLSTLSLVTGTLLATFCIFAPPILLLSVISPYLVKYISTEGSVGKSAGRIMAISTVGSIIGVMLYSFYIIPELGLFKSLYIIMALILLPASLGLILRGKKSGFVLLLLFVPQLVPPFDDIPQRISRYNNMKVVLDTESRYSRIMVMENDEAIMVIPNILGPHSVFSKQSLMTGGYWDFLTLSGFISSPVHDILILGCGSGSSIRQYLAFFPEARIAALDIDEKMLEIGKVYFNLGGNPRIDFIADDARHYLRINERKFDVIAIDIYTGGPDVPFYCLTKEFFSQIRSRLTENGSFVMNVIDPKGTTVSEVIMNTAAMAFPSIFHFRANDLNTIMIGTAQPMSREEFTRRLKSNSNHILSSVVSTAIDTLKVHSQVASRIVFTDNLAPIEKMTHQQIHGLLAVRW
jgi:predicted membrane-bound spermidine synthase